MEAANPVVQSSSTVEGAFHPVIREHIVSSPDTCGGKPRIAGSRIQVKHVVIMHEGMGMSAAEIVSEHPHLTPADVYAALAYYHDCREEVDADIRTEREWYEEMKAGPSLLREKLQQRADHGADHTLPLR